MIEKEHYVAYWTIFDVKAYFNGEPQALFVITKRFRTKEEAEKKVAEELEKFKILIMKILVMYPKNQIINLYIMLQPEKFIHFKQSQLKNKY